MRAALLISLPEPNRPQSSKLALSLAAAYRSGFGALQPMADDAAYG